MSGATAVILPGEILLAEAAHAVTPARPYLVITERGQCAVVPQVLPGMQKIAVQTFERDEREAA